MRTKRRGSWITELLGFVAGILETLLSSSAASGKQDQRPGGSQHDNGTHDHQGQNDGPAEGDSPETVDEVQAAFDFFEVVDTKDDTSAASTGALRDAVKKKFRKLSLVHHPDRNNNSQDSNEIMQKVNHYYDVLCEELDRRDGTLHVDDPEEPGEETKKEQAEPTRRQKKNRRRNRNRAEKARRRREYEAQKEMEEEMQEIRRQQQKVNAEKRKRKAKIKKVARKHNLNTEWGREKANQAFVEAVARTEQVDSAREEDCNRTATAEESMCDIDEDNDGGGHNGPSSTSSLPKDKPKKEKPKNLVMEFCMNDIAVALQMGLGDVAISSIQEELTNMIISTLFQISQEHECMTNELDFELATEAARTRLFQTSLDDDGNTILHYAVYYESIDVVDLVNFHAGSADILPEVFLKKNRFGWIPLDFCKCCVKDESLPERMQSLTDAARAMQPTSEKAFQRLKDAIWQVDWISLLNTISSVGIGVGVFHTYVLTALAVSTLHQRSSVDKLASHARIAGLLALHASWWVSKLLLLFMISHKVVSVLVLALALVFANFYGSNDLVFLLMYAFPHLLERSMSYVLSCIPVLGLVKSLRLDDLQFYLLFSVASLLLQPHVEEIWTSIVDPTEYVDAPQYRSSSMNDAVKRFAALEADEGEEMLSRVETSSF